jgi:hypothetical protein
MRIVFKKHPYGRWNMDGCYDRTTSSLIIQKDLKLRLKIITIIHEFGHYLIDKLGFGGCGPTDYVYDVICILLDPTYKNKKKTFRWLAKYYFKCWRR